MMCGIPKTESSGQRWKRCHGNRGGTTQTAVFNGKLFLTGGMNLEGAIFKDVWVTEDGIHWRLLTDSPPWESRQGHALESYKGKLWLIGRFNDTSNGGPNNVWYTENGMRWDKTATNPQWKGREDFFSTIFKDKIWIFGGMDADWRWRNDVWQGVLVTPVSQQTAAQHPQLKQSNDREIHLSADSSVTIIIEKNKKDHIFSQKNKEKEVPVASITKVMTALIASEILQMNAAITIDESALTGKGVSGKFSAGETISLRDALHAMLIESNNEVAIAITETVGREKFIQKMNNRASQLNMFNTHFFNETGLDPGEGSSNTNYATASDIAKLITHLFKK